MKQQPCVGGARGGGERGGANAAKTQAQVMEQRLMSPSVGHVRSHVAHAVERGRSAGDACSSSTRSTPPPWSTTPGRKQPLTSSCDSVEIGSVASTIESAPAVCADKHAGTSRCGMVERPTLWALSACPVHEGRRAAPRSGATLPAPGGRSVRRLRHFTPKKRNRAKSIGRCNTS
jgi:hypothetical protein